MRRILTWAVLTSCFTPLIASAAPFQDLDFEQVVIDVVPPYDDPGNIQASAAFPGWTAVVGGQPVNDLHTAAEVPLDGTYVALVDSSSNAFHALPIDGDYNLELDATADGRTGESSVSSLSQTGDVPAGTRSIRFVVGVVGLQFLHPIVSLNGTPIDVFPLSTGGQTEQWGGDISAFAGTTATLTFAAASLPGPFPDDEVIYDVDDISFSPAPVPEPVASMVIVLGGIICGGRHRL